MDEWGWEQLRPWLAARVELPVGPLFCVIDGRTRGRPWAAAAVRSEFRRVAARAGVRHRFTPHQLRHAHALEVAREGLPLNIMQRQLGHAILGTTSIYLQGIDLEEIITAVRSRRAPMMSPAPDSSSDRSDTGKTAGAPRGATAPLWRSECTDTCGREHRSSSFPRATRCCGRQLQFHAKRQRARDQLVSVTRLTGRELLTLSCEAGPRLEADPGPRPTHHAPAASTPQPLQSASRHRCFLRMRQPATDPTGRLPLVLGSSDVGARVAAPFVEEEHLHRSFLAEVRTG
jgi:Phage integrase family